MSPLQVYPHHKLYEVAPFTFHYYVAVRVIQRISDFSYISKLRRGIRIESLTFLSDPTTSHC